MKNWFSIVDLIGLPNLPTTRRCVLEKAKREQWLSRPRNGKGGGSEYHISSLPSETQTALTIKSTNEAIKQLNTENVSVAGKIEASKLRIKAEMSEQIQFEKRAKSLIKSEGLQEIAKTRMNAKLEVIKMLELFLSTSTTSKTTSIVLFCEAYNSGQIEVADWVRMTVPTTSQGSILRWNKIIREEGISKLAGAYGNRKGSGKINQNKEIQDFILSMIHDFPHCKPNHVHQGILARFHNLNFDLPDIKTVNRWMNKWKQENKELFTLIDNPDEWRNKFMVAIGDASEKVERYLQLWEMDSTPADIMLEDGRYTIIGLIDIWSRRFKLLVSKTSKSASVAALIRHCIIAWGVPETIKTDNGADYVSYHITRTLKLLEIEQELCTPFQPWEKPHVERAFGTFSRDILELMSGFIGHNVAERKAIEERKSFADRLMKKGETVHIALTSEQLQSFCDKWTEHIYFHKKHSGTNKSPFEMINSWQNPVRNWSNHRALDLLLAEAPGKNGERRVGKKGIALDKFMYWADELIEYVGETVRVFYDPTNAGRIQVYDHEMTSICTAECPNITGISRKELAKKATQIQKKRISEAKSNLKSISRKNSTKNISTEILEHCAEKSANLTVLPKQTIEYSTNALQSAADAIENIDAMYKPSTFEELDQAGSESFSPEAQARVAEIIHLDMKRKNAKDTEEYDKDLREKRYEDLLARNFESISEEDDNWRRSWETTSEYYAWEMLKELKFNNSLPSQENA